MALARKVKPGQVWTAKISGRDVEVEILGEASPSASGRKRFKVENLSTGRTAIKGAGGLKRLVREKRQASANPAAAPLRVAPAAPPRANRARGSAPTPARTVSPPVAAPSFNAPSAPLGSLRGASASPGGHGARPATRNPPASAYPSRAAHQAAKALAQSDAQTPAEVLAVIQAWARSARMSEADRYAAFAPGGVPAGYMNPPRRRAPHPNPYGPPRHNPQAFYGSSW